jgi:formylmethanofuran dehydrogenase subunit E-like metal-binding protein
MLDACNCVNSDSAAYAPVSIKHGDEQPLAESTKNDIIIGTGSWYVCLQMVWLHAHACRTTQAIWYTTQ